MQYAHWPRLRQIHQNVEQKSQHRSEEARQLRNKAASTRAANAEASKQVPLLQAELAELRAHLARQKAEHEASCAAMLDEDHRMRVRSLDCAAHCFLQLAAMLTADRLQSRQS